MAFDEVSSPVLAKKFSSSDFSPEDYVKRLVSKCDMYRSLQDHQKEVQRLGDETSISLKKNVYRNYRQFIDTSKEISYLEAEMYQLNHLLTEQKSLLADQLETSIFERPKGLPNMKDPAKEEVKAKKKNFLNNLVATKETIRLLSTKDIFLDGELTEYDTDTYEEFQKVCSFLLTDSLLITTNPRPSDEQSAEERAAEKCEVLNTFDLSEVAVVNVRDGQGIKNAFKILYSLDSRMFSAPTKESKLAWMDQIEKAKKNYGKGVPSHARKFSEFRKSFDFDCSDEEEAEIAEEKQESPPSEDPFENSTAEVNYPNLLNVDWLVELPEDLDMRVAQRDFEGAAQLVDKGLAYLKDFPENAQLASVRTKIETRVQHLCETLEKSLDNSTSSRHVSLRSIRVYVQLLIRLGRGKLACELFLRNRSFELNHSYKQLKMEGATQLFITKLANVFFTAVIETGKEYKKIFPTNASCSAFIIWSHDELQKFAEKFTRQVFSRNADLAAVATCVHIALEDCHRLEVIGMDLTFDLEQMLLRNTMAVIFDCRDQLLERVKHKTESEVWTPIKSTIQTGKDQGHVVIDLTAEITALGVDLNGYTGDNQILLSDSTIVFTKCAIGFLSNGLRLYTPELHQSFVQCVGEIFKAQVIQFYKVLELVDSPTKLDFIGRNIDFVRKNVLSIMAKRLQEVVGREVKSIVELAEEFQKLKKLANVRKSKGNAPTNL